jgi:hypothetical protein
MILHRYTQARDIAGRGIPFSSKSPVWRLSFNLWSCGISGDEFRLFRVVAVVLLIQLFVKHRRVSVYRKI